MKINGNSNKYNIEFIAGIQGTSNMILDPYNDNGKLFSNIDQTDTTNIDFSGWELFTDREATHEHYSSIIPFNTKITVNEPEHLLFQSNLNDLYENYQVNQSAELKVGSVFVAGYNDYEQRIKSNLELYMVDPHKNLILKANNYFLNDKKMSRIHGIWDKTITQNSNFDMQEYLYYFKENSTPLAYIWDTNEVTGTPASRYTWYTHNSYGLTSKTTITAPTLTGNNGNFQIPNYQTSQTTFNSLSTNMYNPDNPRSLYLTQKNYTAADVSNGTFNYNTFNKFYPRAEPLVEMYIKDINRYDAKFYPTTGGLLPKITADYEEPIYYVNNREPLSSDMSFVFNLNKDDNQYNRIYRNNYLNYVNLCDISYATGYNSNTNMAHKNIEGSIEEYKQNTKNKHSGNLTIGSFIPQQNNNNNFDTNHPDWETKGKEVARYALLYTNDHRIDKPILKPEYHGYYWKMTNYQGWTNETDISNSTELSSMIFHYERENIGIYRKELYYNEINDPDNKTNWKKWQIDDTPTFNNYDTWIYDQKQNIIHSSLVLCDYNSDIFFNGILKIHVLDDKKHAFIFQKVVVPNIYHIGILKPKVL